MRTILHVDDTAATRYLVGVAEPRIVRIRGRDTGRASASAPWSSATPDEVRLGSAAPLG